MSTIAQRVKEIISYKKLSILGFEKSIAVGNNSIGTAIKRNSNVSGDILSKILNIYTDISADWLLTGKGSMLRQADNCTTKIEEFNKILEENYELKQVEKYLEEKIAALKEEISSVQKELIQSKNEIIALERKVQSLLNKK